MGSTFFLYAIWFRICYLLLFCYSQMQQNVPKSCRFYQNLSRKIFSRRARKVQNDLQYHRPAVSLTLKLYISLWLKKKQRKKNYFPSCCQETVAKMYLSICSVNIGQGLLSNNSNSKIVNFIVPFPFTSLKCERVWNKKFLIRQTGTLL